MSDDWECLRRARRSERRWLIVTVGTMVLCAVTLVYLVAQLGRMI